MPIYEYECKQCKERHEIIQRFSDAPLEHCAKCGGEMKKLISSPAIQFKGSGFYKTDYAGSKSETRNQKPEETKSEKSEGTKSEGTKSETSKSESSTKSET